MKNKYSDKELKRKKQTLFLGVAGFVIKMVFEPTEQIFFKRKLIEGIQEIWGKGGFLESTPKGANFEIGFIDANLIEVLHKERRSKQFYLTFRRDFTSHRVIGFYHTGPLALQMLLKEVFTLLLKKDGFLLHASSCLDKSGNLKLFLAPSGGGKTTVASLLSRERGLVQFSDDILVVRKQKSGWGFYSPPFVEKQIVPVKKEAKKAELFFIKKSKAAAKKEIYDSKKVLRLLLKQIWSKTGDIDKKTLKNAMAFSRENRFYWLNSVLDAKAIKRVLYED